MLITKLIFWASAVVLLHVYVGFPVLLWLRSTLCKQPVSLGDITPALTVIIVAHNEAASIGRKLENLLALDYPRELLNIIVASDGSDDATDQIVASYPNVTLLSFPRRGKIPALNDAVGYATGEILVFSDANSIFLPESLRMLVRPFSDPTVGGVAGKQCYNVDGPIGSTENGERAYWNFDQKLKQWQSDAGSLTSATGAIYAIRRKLFVPLPPAVSDDAVNSYSVVAAGFRMVFEPTATAYEQAARSGALEFKRKVRVCVRGLRGLRAIPGLLNPLRTGFYSLQLISHKLLRWMGGWAMAALAISSILLRDNGRLYAGAALMVTVFFSATVIAIIMPGRMLSWKPLSFFTFPLYLCLANSAFILAQIKVARGERIDAWEVRRAFGRID